MRSHFAVITTLLLFAFGAAMAGDLNRTGTVSGAQLLIPVGARSISMGGASIANINGAESIYWNPAGMSNGTASEVMFNNMAYIADIDVNYLAAVYNGGIIGSFGLSIKSLDFGDIEETTFEQPDGTGQTWSPTQVVAGLSYSRFLTDRIRAGLTGKLIYESIQQTSAQALALDMGVQYEFNANLSLGVVMKNIGQKMEYTGRDMDRPASIPNASPDADNGFFRAIAQASNIPSVFSFGVNYKVNINEENHLAVNGAFSNFNDYSDQLFGGVEYSFRDFFFLRGGYNYETQTNLDTDEDQLFGASFGAGINYPVGNFNFQLDYAYRDVTDYFDASNIFTVKLSF